MTKPVVLLSLGLLASCVTTDEGRRMQEQILELQQRSLKNELGGVELRNEMQKQADDMRRLLDEAKRLTVSLADASQKAERVQLDIMQVQGRFEDISKQMESLQRTFTDYRSQSDSKLGQISSTLAKNPPLPESPDTLFTEAHAHFVAGRYAEARYMLDAFVTRYPADTRAARAQSMIGDSHYAEGKYRYAIYAYTKILDNFPRSDEVEIAIFKNGQSFLQLKFCKEARAYFEQFVSRYPRSRFRSEASERLKEISQKAKDKSACTTS
jgi:TolA-binding protein